VPHETLKDAATLTLWFSDLRKNGKGEEINTLRKFVKKAKDQKPGSVQVTRTNPSGWNYKKKARTPQRKSFLSLKLKLSLALRYFMKSLEPDESPPSAHLFRLCQLPSKHPARSDF